MMKYAPPPRGEVLVPPPHDEVPPRYLMVKCHCSHGEVPPLMVKFQHAQGKVPPPHNGMCNAPNAGSFDTNPPP